jgi:hypothetical protein
MIALNESKVKFDINCQNIQIETDLKILVILVILVT